ncbi:GTPase of the mitochondrial inner membrane that associates with the large ribosomal subunit [Fusarium torreyae]|uniref:GTPase of the mitochondrial inner membrane that associates with the large ribosomal subunit n=1 Tax=Fusarium torreyae TaxID=1237075 RepID=A0A9W8SDI0_9HYPO|nr:GTPase of the mitochondrial inner membrane that associates with the large ribosomal subunit [Fusarium torreyae]
MAPRCPTVSSTFLPFLYPSVFLSRHTFAGATALRRRYNSTVNDLPESRLNPAPDDYASPSFSDKAQLALYGGRGGNGCISFLREAYLAEGPPNGGDGGHGGNVYIQAAHGETSLHKLARKRFIRAGRGKHGQGSAKSGTRGDDIIITVPVGTVVRELEREDPIADEELDMRLWRVQQKQKRAEERLAALERKQRQAENEEGYEEEEEEIQEEEEEEEEDQDPERRKWLLYPGLSKTDVKQTVFPRLPKRTRLLKQPPPTVHLDLSRPTPKPILLATGGIGGLGNPHFTSRAHPRPMFATKGEDAVTMKIELELKLLADVGLVGLPNAGKSTLLRAITNSRTRVGNWAFTTLQPNIGTVVLDKYSGRPTIKSYRRYPAQLGLPEAVESEPRTRFTIADIPGLIEGAHLDRGLGIAFLRHVERAGVLAFVIDLAAGNAVKALDSLWREVGLYAQMRDEEEADREVEARVDWDVTSDMNGPMNLSPEFESGHEEFASTQGLQIAGKPWFVVATKADLPETQENFKEVKQYLDSITKGEKPHPSGVEDAWTKDCAVIPVSAINGQGVDRIVHWTVGLLDE